MPKGIQGFQKGHKGFRPKGTYCHTQTTKNKIGNKHKGMKHTNKSKILMSKHHKGQIPWILGKHWSKCMRLKMSKSKKGCKTWNKGIKMPQISGENHYCWKGGVTPLYIMIRKSIENKEWIRNIFIKDNYICQKCKIRSGLGKKIFLEAHHIKPFAQILKEFLQQYSQFSPIEDKETLARLAITYQPFWDTNNGITLCKKCHLFYKKKATQELFI